MITRFVAILLFFLATGAADAVNAPAIMAVAVVNQDGKPSVKVHSYGVELIVPSNDREYNFRIYSITGQVVKSVRLSEGKELVELPQGCYIIKCEAWSKKIVIR